MRSQAICFEPKKSWKILADLPRRQAGLPAEGRSPEAENSYHPIWLRREDSEAGPCAKGAGRRGRES
ncbi:MAG: hypothetical protein A2912_00950 [Candidatus Buchananbacteria bacterium RIFCSPLOWO2_01_FULL_40_23b]|uniref:Uncharacterized protein n=1 Tax=Candidatus Buchananbacteria bacterium RIFCSPLOWO2_01_FULL_40_23b TaxID=1797544 RepID=A0A1G1YQC4_9BACT|nr:MAG: hypothetical protein A2912_00950 [Candidatus Buchananbacteria bacterium RIFCSPLOWO2_01_FULL_40_23b]